VELLVSLPLPLHLSLSPFPPLPRLPRSVLQVEFSSSPSFLPGRLGLSEL
jgi:hypothetical protein